MTSPPRRAPSRMRPRGGLRLADPPLLVATATAGGGSRGAGVPGTRRRVQRAPRPVKREGGGGGRGLPAAAPSSAPGYAEPSSDSSVSSASSPSRSSSSSASKGPEGRRGREAPSWVEMEPSLARKGPERKGSVLCMGSSALHQRRDSKDSKTLPREKQEVHGKRLQVVRQAHLKPKSKYRKRDAPQYASGSLEEQWHLAILDKGRVTCPVCRAAARKTVEGLKKHMANCQQELFTCHHCGKQLRSLAGMKYHLMADHNTLLTGKVQDEQSERERLRQVLKRLGKLKCTREGCTGSFTSIVGYLYHTQKCGKAAAELETLAARCPHCGKAYRSKAGLVYHMKSEHGPAPFLHEDAQAGPPKDSSTEPNSGRRLQRKSAKVAAYYLHELAHVELAKEWPKRKVLQDLVPDDRKLKYTRPGLPAVSQEVLSKWRAEIKAYRQVQCPNQGCTCVYSSISGLKSHLGSCTLGEFVAGKYRCLLCGKEFVSESGVKYHINVVHAEDWFDIRAPTSKRPQPPQPAEPTGSKHRKKPPASRSRKRRPPPRAVSPKRPSRPGPSQYLGNKASRSRASGSKAWSMREEVVVGPPPLKLSHKRGRK